ncbi:putative methyltransferase YcgJ [Oxobacter pfennigii]|uniref:Putative methyltransferase YcgJ n=1 Tax=Oxobacter pfennigii TaxID=36849 RepID=A0A0P8YCF1_9CLOT|nr:class I SAM-dependent methyltransferase [Oxobacter pfennigii]KPU44825.1 putative methyltransferase YcgJ [Oxobacter pfennigii]
MFNTTKIWDYWANKYDGLWVQKYSLTPTRKAVISTLSSVLDKGKKIKLLDMGCGTGQLIREIKTKFKDYDIECTGVDISNRMIDICKNKDKTSSYITSSIENFEYNEGEFDIIICTHSFPYYQDKAKAIEKFHRLLKKNGYFILAQASVNSFYDSLAMFFVKLTTSKAAYPSIDEVLNLIRGKFKSIDIVSIKEKAFMPAICLFLFLKEGD